MAEWIILRTAGSTTLQLARTLAEAGFVVWTPTTVEIRRTGLHRTRKEFAVPLMARWVFARSERLLELVELSRSASLLYQVWDSELRRMVTKGIPKFSVFRDSSGFRPVRDDELAPLRRRERKGKPKDQAREFKVGETVRATDGPFDGMVGVVEKVRLPYVSVAFPRSNHVPKLPFWVLAPVEEMKMEKAA